MSEIIITLANLHGFRSNISLNDNAFDNAIVKLAENYERPLKQSVALIRTILEDCALKCCVSKVGGSASPS